MSCQAQSVVSLISHLPFEEPPQGPLRRDLLHLAMGQMPPVSPRMQSPQAAQRSAHTPCSTGRPRKLVFSPGTTIDLGKRSANVCTPMPQPSESTTSTSSIASLSGSMYSHSHWRCTVTSVTSFGLPSSLVAMRRDEDRICASFSPPAKQ